MNDNLSMFSIIALAIISALFYLDRRAVKNKIKLTDNFTVAASSFKKLIYLAFELVFIVYLVDSIRNKTSSLASTILIGLLLVYNAYLFYRNRLSLRLEDQRVYLKDPLKEEIILSKDQLAFNYNKDQRLIYVYKARDNKPIFIANENHLNYSNLKNYLFKNQIKKKI